MSTRDEDDLEDDLALAASLLNDDDLAGWYFARLLEALQQHPPELMRRVIELTEQGRLALSWVDGDKLQLRDFVADEIVMPPTRVQTTDRKA